MRYHDLAKVETTGDNARTMISLLRGKPYALPLKLEMVERHPFGSQAFVPLSINPFLVVAAHDSPDGPSEPVAFLTQPGQGVNIHRNVWHGILTPLQGESDFVVIDRGGDGVNLRSISIARRFSSAEFRNHANRPPSAWKGGLFLLLNLSVQRN